MSQILVLIGAVLFRFSSSYKKITFPCPGGASINSRKTDRWYFTVQGNR